MHLSSSKGKLAGNQRIYEGFSFKRCQVLCTFTQADEFNWYTKLTLNGYHDTALGRTIKLGQDNTGDIYGIGEDLRLGKNVLYGGGIKYQDHLSTRASAFCHP